MPSRFYGGEVQFLLTIAKYWYRPSILTALLTSTQRARVIARNWQRSFRGCQLPNSPNKLTGQPSAPDSGSEDGSKPSSALPRIEAKEPRAKKQRMFGIDQSSRGSQGLMSDGWRGKGLYCYERSYSVSRDGDHNHFDRNRDHLS